MRITQVENGNIIIKDSQDKTIAITPKIYVFKHPRKQNAIVINGSGIYNDELNSIEGNLQQGIYVNDNKHTSLDTLFADLSNQIVLSGKKASAIAAPSDNEPNRAVFESITDYEVMYLFTKEYSKTVNPIKKDETGKIIEEEYLLQFTDLVARITLTYYYLSGNTISHILMSGTTQNIALPIKTYMYDANNNISHTYEVVTWKRYTNSN